MPQSSDLVAIDIGSRSICAYAAERLSDDAFTVKASCEIEYDGYYEGRWVKSDEVLPSIFKLLDKLERTLGKIKTVYVGIPSDFCEVRILYDKTSFPKAKRIIASDLDEIFDYNDPFSEGAYERISVRPVSFVGDGGERLEHPIGEISSSLKSHLSYVGAAKEILVPLRNGLMRHGVKTVRFVPAEYAAAQVLFGKEELAGGVLLADVGYNATSLLHLTGEALLEMRTFALGGSMIPECLSGRFDVSYRVASALLPKINLGYREEGEYSLKYDASTYVYPVADVNGLVKECVDCLALYLNRAIKSFRYEIPSDTPLYVTGGGLCEIRFVREYLAKALCRRVEFVQPSTPNFAKPYYSTAVGVIRAGMEIEKKDRFGFLKRLFKI